MIKKKYAYIVGELKGLHINAKEHIPEGAIGVIETDLRECEGRPVVNYNGEDVTITVNLESYGRNRAKLNGFMEIINCGTVTQPRSKIQDKGVNLSDYLEIKELYETIMNGQ